MKTSTSEERIALSFAEANPDRTIHPEANKPEARVWSKTAEEPLWSGNFQRKLKLLGLCLPSTFSWSNSGAKRALSKANDHSKSPLWNQTKALLDYRYQNQYGCFGFFSQQTYFSSKAKFSQSFSKTVNNIFHSHLQTDIASISDNDDAWQQKLLYKQARYKPQHWTKESEHQIPHFKTELIFTIDCFDPLRENTPENRIPPPLSQTAQLWSDTNICRPHNQISNLSHARRVIPLQWLHAVFLQIQFYFDVDIHCNRVLWS